MGERGGRITGPGHVWRRRESRPHIRRMKHDDEGHPFSFHLPDLAGRESGEVVLLDEEESRHIRSLRLAEGSSIALTDGRGNLRAATLGALRGSRREARLGEEIPVRAPAAVELAVAVGNRNRMLWLIEKAAEFGIERVSLLETERSRSVSDAGRSASFRDKAERRALAALKQSGGARLPEIVAVRELSDYLSNHEPRDRGVGFVLDGTGAPLAGLLDDSGRRVTLLVGPEGGLSDAEVESIERAGFRRAGLGPSILRFETAALAGLAVVVQHDLLNAKHGGGPPRAKPAP